MALKPSLIFFSKYLILLFKEEYLSFLFKKILILLIFLFIFCVFHSTFKFWVLFTRPNSDRENLNPTLTILRVNTRVKLKFDF